VADERLAVAARIADIPTDDGGVKSD